jgi:amino acid permease
MRISTIMLLLYEQVESGVYCGYSQFLNPEFLPVIKDKPNSVSIISFRTCVAQSFPYPLSMERLSGAGGYTMIFITVDKITIVTHSNILL